MPQNLLVFPPSNKLFFLACIANFTERLKL